jgi:cytidylate kinase
MKKTSPFVITISRQLGSGGAYIGQQLAKKLNILYADREIITQAAKQLSMLTDAVEARDEKLNSFWQSFLEACTYSSPYGYIPPQNIIPTDRELFEAEADVIKRIAKEGSAVIIGRCGSYVLREHPNLISVFLHGNVDFRESRVQEIYKVSKEEAVKMVAKSDIQRADYHYAHTGKKWTDLTQYDICLDTSKLGIENSLEVILKYLEF